LISFKQFQQLVKELNSQGSLEEEEILRIFQSMNKTESISLESVSTWWSLYNDSPTNPNTLASSKILVESIIDNLKLETKQSDVLGYIGPGEIIGEISLLEGGGASASVIAHTEVELYVIEGFVLAILSEWKPDVAMRFFKYIAAMLEKRLHTREKALFEDNESPRTPRPMTPLIRIKSQRNSLIISGVTAGTSTL